MTSVPVLTKERKIRIAQAIANGIAKEVIAQAEGVGRATIFRWAKDPEVIAKIKEIENQTISAAQQIIHTRQTDRAEELTQQLQEYGDRRRKSAIALQKTAFKMLQKLNERIDSLNPTEVSVRDLSGLCRAVADMIEKGAAAEADALGVEQMMETIADRQSNI